MLITHNLNLPFNSLNLELFKNKFVRLCIGPVLTNMHFSSFVTLFFACVVASVIAKSSPPPLPKSTGTSRAAALNIPAYVVNDGVAYYDFILFDQVAQMKYFTISMPLTNLLK